MIEVRFARRAVQEMDRLETWSRANGQSFWPLFVREIDRAVRLLRTLPELGHPYEAGPPGVRRLLLDRVQFYAYYRYHRDLARVVILSLWSTRRRRSPSFR